MSFLCELMMNFNINYDNKNINEFEYTMRSVYEFCVKND
jgi:hypothetical protein